MPLKRNRPGAAAPGAADKVAQRDTYTPTRRSSASARRKTAPPRPHLRIFPQRCGPWKTIWLLSLHGRDRVQRQLFDRKADLKAKVRELVGAGIPVRGRFSARFRQAHRKSRRPSAASVKRAAWLRRQQRVAARAAKRARKGGGL